MSQGQNFQGTKCPRDKTSQGQNIPKDKTFAFIIIIIIIINVQN